jgi:hypothetical protein
MSHRRIARGKGVAEFLRFDADGREPGRPTRIPRLASHPFFAIAALVLAGRRYLRAAIVVLAAFILVAWLSDLPTMAGFGIEWDWSTLGLPLAQQ